MISDNAPRRGGPALPAAARVAMVTGAVDGIGWAVARRLADEVPHVVLADLREDAAIARAAELGPAHLGMRCNVSREEEVAALFGAVCARFGRLDILVNNAGIGEQAAGTLQQGVDGFDRVVDVHLRGTFLMCREAGRTMVAAGRGSIVNLGSIAGLAGIPARNAYGAAKAGILSMTRSLACEWARSGVRVNAVAPGYVRTALVERLAREGALDVHALEARTPMGRMADPGEIAEAVAFLASDRASFITGTTLNVDGGWLALGAPEAVLHSNPDAA